MDHFVGHCVFELSLVLHLVGAKQNAIFRIEATALSVCTTATMDVVLMKITS